MMGENDINCKSDLMDGFVLEPNIEEKYFNQIMEKKTLESNIGDKYLRKSKCD